MNTLLVLPAVGVMYLQAVGRDKALRLAMIMAQVQIVLASPFLATYPRSYLSRAFEFTRQFIFKWTVNWRFIGEETFLSKQFALTLLWVHATLLVVFLTTRWKKPSHRPFSSFLSMLFSPPTGLEERQISLRVTPRYVLTAILSANTLGMLCARSLHYQFYSWLAWGTPYVLWRSGFGPVWIVPLWAMQEWAWNVFPSTNLSSAVVTCVLALSTAGIWWGDRKEETVPEEPEKKRA